MQDGTSVLPITKRRLLVIATVAALLVAACTSDDAAVSSTSAALEDADATSAPLPEATTIPAPASPSTATTSNAGGSLEPTTTVASTPSSRSAGSVLLVGDSSLAGIRWYDGAAERLRGAAFTLDAESCRRVAVPSCGGRENRIPVNVVQRIRQATPQEYDAVVVMSGYNDDGADFERALGEVLASARAVGAPHTVFLTLTTPTPGRSSIVTNGQNQAVRAFRAGADEGDTWIVADWQTYSAPFMDQWFEEDHVHLSPTGSYAAADYISQVVAHVLDAPCPGETGDRCTIPTAPRPEEQADYATAPRVRCLEVGDTRELVCEPVD